MLRFIFRLIGTIFVLIILFVATAFWYLFLTDRPVNTDPDVLAGDGSLVDYCEMPILDGDYTKGKMAAEIPKGNTPNCGYEHFPLPILEQCREPLSEGADDLRGLWQAVPAAGSAQNKKSKFANHIERIEQCGSRTVVTTSGIIHDYGPNSTGVLNTNDTEGSVLFTRNGKEYCNRTSASMIWRESDEGKPVLEFNAFGWGPVVVKRYLKNDHLIWEYADGSVTTMKRICKLPDSHKIPQKRGPRYAL